MCLEQVGWVDSVDMASNEIMLELANGEYIMIEYSRFPGVTPGDKIILEA